MSNNQLPDAILVQKYIAGEELALSKLVERHQSRIYGFIYSKLNDRDLCDDIFQDTFVKVIKTLKTKTYNEEGKFLPWVIRIAHNLIVDHYRKNKKMPMTRETETFSIFEFIKDTLEKHNVTTVTTVSNFSPINSTINIVSSHGDRDISSTQVFYPDENHVIHNLNGILGEGKILVLLVCHSGSEKEFFFRNEIASLIKRYLSNGYEAVVAPFWSLHINIPPLWLPTFLSEIDEGKEVSEAVFAANKSVYNVYPTSAAWTCMHLFGNPFYSIPKK